MRLLPLILCCAAIATASEGDALAISANIRDRHMPFGALLDPMFRSESSDEIVRYTRCGDSAIWTGHYLAAEAFRYSVTSSEDALANVRHAIRGIRSLVDVTGTDLLARCLVPADSPFARDIMYEERHHGKFPGTIDGVSHVWMANTSRDQYSGVFFGLGVAWDLVDEDGIRSDISALVTRITDFLLANRWAVVMPDSRISTVFWHRPEQILTFLQVARGVNPERFEKHYIQSRQALAPVVGTAIAFEVVDTHRSYFKFNLGAINLYHLVRLEDNAAARSLYAGAYGLLRAATRHHPNAHFNMVDRALKGPDEMRDAKTRALIEAWLQRPRRDSYVDLRERYLACGNEERACDPIPLIEQVRTDFLWQRSPYLLFGGGEGRIEGAGIDYILPYWMARYYAVLDADVCSRQLNPGFQTRDLVTKSGDLPGRNRRSAVK
jgi:hypothetical protein